MDDRICATTMNKLARGSDAGRTLLKMKEVIQKQISGYEVMLKALRNITDMFEKLIRRR